MGALTIGSFSGGAVGGADGKRSSFVDGETTLCGGNGVGLIGGKDGTVGLLLWVTGTEAFTTGGIDGTWSCEVVGGGAA